MAKATQKEFFTALKEFAEKNPTIALPYVNSKGENCIIDADEMIETSEKRLGQLENKASAGKDKASEERNAFIDVLLSVMEKGKKYQCCTLIDEPEIAAFKWADGKKTSGQRCAYVLNDMAKNGLVTKVTEKKVTYFSVV